MRIAVSTDFSRESIACFRAAESLARSLEAELLVVYQADPLLVVPPLPYEEDDESFRELDPRSVTAELRRRLERLVETEFSGSAVPVRPGFIEPGDIEVFGRYLREEGVDLVVMSSHGRTGLRRFLLGSFAEKVLRLGASPVLVFRVADGGEARDDFVPRRILAPCDLTPSGRAALETAFAWADRFDARLRLLHVIAHDPGVLGCAADVVGGWIEYHRRLEEDARHQLRTRLEGRPSRARAEIEVSVGAVVGEILEHEERCGAELVVVGTRHRTGMEHFWLGSVAEGVVRRARSPVLVVPEQPGEMLPAIARQAERKAGS